MCHFVGWETFSANSLGKLSWETFWTNFLGKLSRQTFLGTLWANFLGRQTFSDLRVSPAFISNGFSTNNFPPIYK